MSSFHIVLIPMPRHTTNNTIESELLKQSFQRNIIESREYLICVIAYVHNNPVSNDFVERKEDWKYSSFVAMLSDKPTKLLRKEIMELFGGKENFIYAHTKFFDDDPFTAE